MRTCTVPYWVWAAPPSIVRRTLEGLGLAVELFRVVPEDAALLVVELLAVGPETWAGETTWAPPALGVPAPAPARQAVTRAAQLIVATPSALPRLTR
jgi:hypothetical protein